MEKYSGCVYVSLTLALWRFASSAISTACLTWRQADHSRCCASCWLARTARNATSNSSRSLMDKHKNPHITKTNKKLKCMNVSVFFPTDLVSLSIAWTCRFVWVPAKTASCCAHWRHNPATRGAPSALSASAACFSLCLRRTFTSSHSFWLTDRSFLIMETEIVRGQERRWVLPFYSLRKRKKKGKSYSYWLH